MLEQGRKCANAIRSESPNVMDTLTESESRHIAHAARNNEAEVVRLMLQCGFAMTATSQHKATPLHWAGFHGNLEMTRLLLTHGPPLDVRDPDHNGTPVGWAIYGSQHGWFAKTGDYAGTVEAMIAAGSPLPASLSGNTRGSRSASDAWSECGSNLKETTMIPRSCDTMVALGSATVSGQTLFAKNSDRPKNEAQPLAFVERTAHSPDDITGCQFLEIPEVPTTWRHIGSRPYWCWGYEHGFNEHQVVIGNEGLHSKLEYDTPKLIGMELVRLGLERGRTAAEAVEVMTGLITRYGQGVSTACRWPAGTTMDFSSPIRAKPT